MVAGESVWESAKAFRMGHHLKRVLKCVGEGAGGHPTRKTALGVVLTVTGPGAAPRRELAHYGHA